MIPIGTVEKVTRNLNTRAATRIPRDYLDALKTVHEREQESLPRLILEEMLEGQRLQEREARPICADVGLPRYYVKLSSDVSIEGGLVPFEAALRRAVSATTSEIPLRSNRCHPLTRENPGNNVGVMAPNIDYSVEPGGGWLDVTTTHKGGAFGTDYRMLFAGEGTTAVKRFVLETVTGHGRRGLACQPAIIGVGIGGTKDQAMSIGKMACTLRTVGDRHPDPVVRELEEDLLNTVNQSGLGVMGLPGGGYAVAVHIEIAYTHSALMPVSVHHFCQAVRRSTARIHEDGAVDYREDPQWFTEYYRRVTESWSDSWAFSGKASSGSE